MCRSTRTFCTAYVAALVVGAATARAQVIGSDLMVSNDPNAGANPSFIQRYSGATGQYFGQFTLGTFPEGQLTLGFGPNNDLYVGAGSGGRIDRFSGTSGQFIRNISPGVVNEGGRQFTFGPDGNLYAFRRTSQTTLSIAKYNPNTGGLIGTLVPDTAGVTLSAFALEFGPDGNLYVGGMNNFVKYDGTTGANLGTFIAPGSGGLFNPFDILFMADGTALVTSGSGANAVLRYNATTGAFLGVFAAANGLNTPFGMAKGPDGQIYVAWRDSGTIVRYDSVSGTNTGTYISSTAIPNPRYLAFTPTPIPEPSSVAFVIVSVFCQRLFASRRRHAPSAAV